MDDGHAYRHELTRVQHTLEQLSGRARVRRWVQTASERGSFFGPC
jgi:hypothetical protein